MEFEEGTRIEEIIKALSMLEPNVINSFVILSINSDKIDSVQAKRTIDGKYHVEILRKLGGQRGFGGNQIKAAEGMSLVATIEVFREIQKNGDCSTIPRLYARFKNRTDEYLSIHRRSEGGIDR